ncbi:hypothetical protein ABTW96_08705 [Nocardia beijingensis]|uniref:hypothetical protein n=1 Tax=Nocardia beijingensis TaxID=95162 RepID=UPI00332E3BA8
MLSVTPEDWIWHAFRDFAALDGSVAEQDALAEQVEVGATKHLAFDHLDAVDVAFDRPAVPGHGQADDDRIKMIKRQMSAGRRPTCFANGSC